MPTEPALSVLALGPPGREKTGWAFRLPGPLVAISGNDGLRSFGQQHKFMHLRADDLPMAREMIEDILAVDGSSHLHTLLVHGFGDSFRLAQHRQDRQEQQQLVDAMQLATKAGIHLYISSHIRAAGPQGKGPVLSDYLTLLDGRVDVIAEVAAGGGVDVHRFFSARVSPELVSLVCTRLPEIGVEALTGPLGPSLGLAEETWAGLLEAPDRRIRERAMTALPRTRRRR